MRRVQFLLKLAGLLLAAVLVGSSSLAPVSPAQAETSQPTLTGVAPSQAANDVDTPVEITGTGFSNEGGVPQVFLGTTPLTQVVWEDATKLTAVVPWELEAGQYDLRVVNPDGGEVTQLKAFEVTQGIGLWTASVMDGGPVHDVIPIRDIPGRLYAFSEATAGIYRSDDYGANWVTAGHEGGQFFTVDQDSPNFLYLNAKQSTDGGASWHDVIAEHVWPGANKMPGQYTQAFPDPTTPGRVFLATAAIPAKSGAPSGLLRSGDYGQTWAVKETGLQAGDPPVADPYVTAMEFTETAIYAGTRDGNLYGSTDSGDTWALLKTAQEIWGAGVESPSIGILKVNPYKTDELWITTHYAVSPNAKIAKMDLGTGTVTQLPSWPADSYPRTLGFLDASTAYIGTLWDNGWVSTDGGSSWTLFKPADAKAGYSLAHAPWAGYEKTFYMADEQYGVQKATVNSAVWSGTDWSGATWTVINTGLHAMSPDLLAIDPTNPARIYAKIAENGWPGIFVSADGGQNWTFSDLTSASLGIRPVTSLVAVSGGRVFAGAHGNAPLGYGPQIYISEDQGGNWTRHSLDPVPTYSDSFHMPWVLKADPQQPGHLLLSAVIGNRDMTGYEFVSEIYRSVNNGDSWTRVGLASQIGDQVHNLEYLAFDPNDSNNVYAAGDNYILKSTDNGQTWKSLLRDDSGQLSGPVAVEPVPPYRVYARDRVSTDGGETWETDNRPFGINNLAFVPGTDTVYISGEGLAYSYNGGTTWQVAEGALGRNRITGLAVGRNGERTVIYVCTPGGEASEAAVSSTAITAQNQGLIEAGVYRMTEVHKFVFLPMITTKK